MNTSILESLVYKHPYYRFLFDIIGLNITNSIYHEETSNIVDLFTNPRIVITSNVITTCYLIQQKSKNQFHVLKIDSDIVYYKLNKSKIINQVKSDIKSIKWMQEPFIKKIITIDTITEDSIDGQIVSFDNKKAYFQNSYEDGILISQFWKLFWKKYFN